MAGLGIDMEKSKKALKLSEESLVVEKKEVKTDLGGMSSEDLSKAAEEVLTGITCSLDNPDDCIACGS